MRFLLAILIALAALAQAAEAATITYTRTDFPSGRPPERQMAPRSTDNDTFEEVFSTGNALDVFSRGRGAGERNPSSITGTDYTSTSAECWPVTVDTATDSTTVYNGPAVVQYVYVNTALSAHTVLLVDGSTTKLTLPASMAAGSSPNIAGTMFRTTLVVDPDNASTGNITVCFRPLDATNTWTP